MRSEKEVIDNVLDVAGKDESVRAVIRTDLLPEREYRYYNFYFVVNDIEKYDGDVFENCFGERILLYRGDRNYPELFPNNTKAHLMVFRDGTTIAVNVMDKDTFLKQYHGEPGHENVWIGDTYLKILDKDGTLPEIERLEEKQTLFAHKPSEAEFSGTCAEFWWVLKTFAEYTLRKELPSAMFYLNMAVRDLLNRMIRWHLFLNAKKPVAMGILDSNMEKLLDAEMFSMYEKTYPSTDYEQIWEAFDAVVKLWTMTAGEVAARCAYVYSTDTEKNMLSLIKSMRMAKGGESMTIKAILTSSLGGQIKIDGKRIPTEFSEENGFLSLLRSVWRADSEVMVISGSPDQYDRNDDILNCLKESFRLSGLGTSEFIMCDRRNSEIVERIPEMDAVILAGGHVPTQNAFMKELGLKEKLGIFNGLIIAWSAGSMNCAETVYAGPELPGEATDPAYERWISGLGLTKTNIFPHFQAVKDEILDGMRLIEDITYADSMGHEIMALNNGSYIVIDDAGEMLYGEAYSIKDGVQELICRNGDSVKLA